MGNRPFIFVNSPCFWEKRRKTIFGGSSLSDLAVFSIRPSIGLIGGSSRKVTRKISSGASPHKNKRKPMPSVGMRRSTRVFGTRVLRSGRRLLTEPHEGNKNVRAAHGENKWTNLLDNSADEGDAADSFTQLRQENKDSAPMDMEVEPSIEERSSEGAVELKNGDRMHGRVYRRKRKRFESASTNLPEDKMYGKKFVRERWRRKCGATGSFETGGKSGDPVSRCRELAVLVNEPSYDCGYWVTRFMASVLSYMTRVRVGMRRMSAFVLSRPIFDAFSAHGVLFIQVYCYPYYVMYLLEYGSMHV